MLVDWASRLGEAIRKGEPIPLGERVTSYALLRSRPPGIVIDALQLRQVLTNHLVTENADPHGLRLYGAIIEGDLDLRGCTIGFPLDLTGCCFTRSVRLDQASLDSIKLARCIVLRVLGMSGTRVDRSMDFSGIKLIGAARSGYSLTANGLEVRGYVNLDNARARGSLQIDGAHFYGSFVMRSGILRGRDFNGCSLSGVGLIADHEILFDKLKAAGALQLYGAQIGGPIIFAGSNIQADNQGTSLWASSLRAGDEVGLADANFAGAVQLSNACISGRLSFHGAKIRGVDSDGYSLVAKHLEAGQVFLSEGFNAVGPLQLAGCHILGDVSLRSAILTGKSPAGNSVEAESLRADNYLLLDRRFRSDGKVSMRSAVIRVLSLADDHSQLDKLGDVTGWKVQDIFGLVRSNRKVAARWLASQPAAQPWQEIADLYDRNGQHSDARWLRYKSAVRTTKATTGPSRFAREIYRWTAGHGYYPWAAVGWLFVVFILSLGLAHVYHDDFSSASTQTIRNVVEGEPGRVSADICSNQAWDIPCLSPIEYALSTALPATAASNAWSPPSGWVLFAFTCLRVAAWAFTALVLAGVTGLLRHQA